MSHKNLMAQCMALIAESNASTMRREGLQTGRTVYLSIVPLFHVAGITTTVRNILTADPTVIRDFDPVGLLATIEKERVTSMFLAPAMWIMVMSHPDFKKYDVSSLVRASYGAAPTPNSVKERILEAFPNTSLMEAFGQTEMSPSVTIMKNQDALRKEGSVGQALFNVEIRVVDDDMNDVPVGTVGEAVYRGASMFKGYYKNIEANREAFKGGWFHSGDLVRQDEDGFLYVVDRKKDMIVSGGGKHLQCGSGSRSLQASRHSGGRHHRHPRSEMGENRLWPLLSCGRERRRRRRRLSNSARRIWPGSNGRGMSSLSRPCPAMRRGRS